MRNRCCYWGYLPASSPGEYAALGKLAEGEEPGSNLLQNNPRVEGVVLPPIPPRDYGTKAPCKETCYGPPTAP